MAVTINTAVDSNYFTLNGTRYARIYQPLLGQVSTEVGIYNAFDTTQQLLASTPFAEFTVDTLTYASADLLIIALLPVIYKYQGTGAVTGAPDWGDIGGTLSNQTDLQSELDGKSDTGHSHSFASLTSKPTTILGFGLAGDAYNKTETNSLLSGKSDNGHGHLTTKGDLLGYATADVRIPVGSDGQILVADSSEANGLGWVTDYAVQSLSTGLFSGGILSINASTTTFDVAAGNGQIVDNTTDPLNPALTFMSWSAMTNITVTDILTQPVTYICISPAGAVLQSTSFPDPTTRRTNIFLGVIVHSNNVNVNVTNSIPIVALDVGAQVQDILHYIGFKNLTGNLVGAASTDLTIQKSAGTAFSQGSNFQTLNTQPHEITLGALNPVTFRYRNQNSSEGLDITDVDPANWDNGGTTTAIAGSPNQATIQRVFLFPSNQIRIQYGQEIFSNMSTALAESGTESFNVETNISDNGLFLGKIIVRSGATDLSDSGDAVFITATGEVSSASVTTTLQAAYNVSSIPQITTDSDGLEVIFQRGSAADTDLVFGVRNGAGTPTFSIAGNGELLAKGNAWEFNGGTAGNAVLTIQADTDNNDEADHPSIRLKQDGALLDWRIGLGRLDDDLSAEGNQLVFTLLAGTADGMFFSPDNGANAYEIMHQNNGGSGSGFDADTLRSFAPTTGTTLNTIALRDANGDLFAADFRADNNVYTGLGATAGNSLRIYGTGVGTANIAYLTWHDSAGTRQGYAGFPSAGHSDLTIYNDASATYIKLESGGGNTGFTYFDTAERQVYHSGLYPTVTSGAYWSGTKQTLPLIGTAGVMEIGKYIDFHLTANSVADSDGRLNLQSANVLDFNGQFECDEIRLEGTADASLSSTTHAFQSGTTTGNNIIMDNNEIMQRSNGAAGTMEFNREGGTVNFYGATAGSIIVAQANSILNLNDNVDLRFGNSGGEGMIYSNGTSIYWDMKADKDIFFRDVTTTRFTFDISNGWLTAANFKLSSDKRLKKNIKPLSKNKGLFNWVSFNPKTELTQKRYGVVADEVIKTNPELVSVDADGFYAVSYTDLFVLDAEHKDKLIAAQTKEIDSLKFRMEEIEARLELLTKELL